MVVLPEPCRPTSMMTTGGGLLRSSLAASPRRVTNSSLTILITIWAGVSDLATSAPTARSPIRLVKSLTTR